MADDTALPKAKAEPSATIAKLKGIANASATL
jgi:hypothetical protein